MEKFYQMLEKIKKYPGMYLGEKSLSQLSYFIGCYSLITDELMGEKLPFVYLFSIYINYEYKTGQNGSDKWWSDIILENKSQAEAFDLFYDYLEKFKNLMKTPEIFQEMKKENDERKHRALEQWKLG